MPDSYVDRILDSARSRLPGAMDNQILFELADVLNDFFRTTTCWRETTVIDIEADVLDYELFADDTPAIVTSLIDVRDKVNSIAVWSTIVDGQTLRLSRAETPGQYNVRTILTVTKKINDEKYPRFPQWIADTYGDVIADGIVGRMAAMPAKPYSSPTHAAYYSRKYKQGAQSARIEANRQHLVGGQAWQYPRFAAQKYP